MWKDWLAVGLGGMLGSVARFAVMKGITLVGVDWVPAATLVVNVTGCFAIGYVSQWAFHRELTDSWWIVGIRVGLLGGLTTFSSFGLDVFREWQSGRLSLSVTLVAAHILFGITAVVLGMTLGGQTTNAPESPTVE